MFLSIVWEWRCRNKWSTTKWTAFAVHCWPEICRLHHSTRQWLRWKRRTGSRSVVKVTYATEFPVTAENCHYPRALPISYTRTKLDHQSSVWRSCVPFNPHFRVSNLAERLDTFSVTQLYTHLPCPGVFSCVSTHKALPWPPAAHNACGSWQFWHSMRGHVGYID